MVKDVILPGFVIIVCLAIGGAAWWWYLGMPTIPSGEPVSTTTEEENVSRETETSSVLVAFLDREGVSDGKSRGCDKVVMVEYSTPPTTTPLATAMQVLFAIDSEDVNGLFSFIARTNDTLRFDRATIVDGIANIYLTGELTGLAGVCDDPRAVIQIEETALQFPTVKSVQIYLNEEPTTLVPDERG